MLHILCFLFRLWMCSHFCICLISRKTRARFTRGVQAIQNLTGFGDSNFWVFGSSKQCSTFYTETSFDRHWQITHLLTWKKAPKPEFCLLVERLKESHDKFWHQFNWKYLENQEVWVTLRRAPTCSHRHNIQHGSLITIINTEQPTE